MAGAALVGARKENERRLGTSVFGGRYSFGWRFANEKGPKELIAASACWDVVPWLLPSASAPSGVPGKKGLRVAPTSIKKASGQKMEPLLTAVIVSPFFITMAVFAVAFFFAPALPNEKSGVNSALGVSPSTADFVNEAAIIN